MTKRPTVVSLDQARQKNGNKRQGKPVAKLPEATPLVVPTSKEPNARPPTPQEHALDLAMIERSLKIVGDKLA